MQRDSLSEFLTSRPAQLVILTAAVAVLIAIGIYIIGKMREKVRETGPSASDFMTNFRELHAQGELSDEEFRTIKAKLAANLQQELKTREPEG
ncbi:MAG TPA: SHOCT domain-containing protein [Pirellulales bacterium]|jgi:uncharacterized membrane protein|nr:SHOCT domain-containing protein [Pirellulales bacterium]